MSEESKRVIVVTDGDVMARRVLEKVAVEVGGRCISLSAGNPTESPDGEIMGAVKRADGDPVLVMVDDGGKRGYGPGEKTLAALADDPEIEIIGAIAVASHTSQVEGVPVQASVDQNGRVVEAAVDKEGQAVSSDRLRGDTVDVLNRLHIPVVIGLGDLGKMDRAEGVQAGARVAAKAVKEIMRRAGYSVGD